MDNAGDHEKKTRAQRKRKAISLLESDNDLSSDDPYTPPKGFEHDSSDDSDCDIKKKIKKLKKIGTSRSNTIHEKNEKKTRCTGRPPLESSKFQRKQKICKKKSQSKNGKIKEEAEAKVPVLKKKLRQTPFLGPHSVIGSWYIASGFTKDLTALFKAFNELESWRFSAFATCWQNLKFSLIYRGRHSFKELLEFTEEVCLWTKKFTSPVHNTKWRVGALYALYGLYHKHPLKHHYKIRMEADEYEHLEYLARSFQNSAENPDPAYIFYKLKADGVFYYVATSDEMGLNFYSAERQQDIMNYEAQWVLHEHSANNIFPEQERNIQKALLEEYEKVKSKLWGDGSEPDKALSYVQPGMLSEVDAFLAGLQKDDQGTTHPVHSMPEKLNIGQKRGAIRDRAAALSTTDDFLKRKQLRSPQKNSMVEHHSPEESTESFPGNETVQEDHLLSVSNDSNKLKKLKEIMECMQPPEKRIPDSSLRSERISRKQTLQEHNHKQNSDATTAGSPETEDFQDILLPNKSFKEKHDECLLSNNYKGTKREHHPEYEKEISSPQQNGNIGHPGSSNSLEKVVGHKEMPGNKNRTSLPQKERKRMPKKSQLRNFRYKAAEQPQALIKNNIPKEDNKPENMLMERVTSTSVAESKTEESNTSQGVVMSEETSPRSKNMNLPQGKRRRGKPRKNRLRKKIARYKPTEHESDTNEIPEDSITAGLLIKKCSYDSTSTKSKATEEIQIPVKNPVEKYQLENRSPEGSLENYSPDYSILTEINFHPQRSKRTEKLGQSFVSLSDVTKESDCSRGTVEKNITAADKVCEDDQAEIVREVHNNEAITPTESVCKGDNDKKIIHSGDICEKVCNPAKSGNLFSDQPQHESIPHTASNRQTISESLSQENCDNMNPKTSVINVEISARMPKEKHQQSILQAESMFVLHISFQVENVIIHTTEFKITKKNLLAIYNDEKKVESLKNKFYPLLPSEYKNHEMLLELGIHKLVCDNSETFLFESPEQDPQSTPDKDYSEQDSQSIAENICELHNDQAVTTTGTDYKEVNNDERIVCTENSSEKVSHQVTSGSSCNDHPKHESILYIVGNRQAVSNSASQEDCEIMNSAENMIYVEISASVPKKKHHHSILTRERMVILQVSFFVKNVLIHFTKFKITKKDLEAIHNDKTKLEQLKKKFKSLLPLKYHNYEMFLQLTNHDTVVDKSGTSLSACSEQDPRLTTRKEYSKDSQTTPEKLPTQNTKFSLVLPQLSSVDVVANTSTVIHAEQTTNFQEETSSSEEILTCKERKNTFKTHSLISQDPQNQSTVNSPHKFVEQAKTADAGSTVLSCDMKVNPPRFSQIKTMDTNNKSRPSTVLNTNDGSEATLKMHGDAVHDSTPPGKPHDTVKPQSESFLGETNKPVGEVLNYIPPTEKVSDILTGNELGCMKSKSDKKQVLSQDSASVEETTNKGSIFSGTKGILEIINDKSPCTHSPPTTLHENSLHSTTSDTSISSTNSYSICSFYFFSKRKQGPLPTRKPTGSSSDSV